MSRAPRNLIEAVIANCRPQPAIPAMLVLVLTLMFAASSVASWAPWAVAAGLVVSCGLAIAAGFCSFFPPLAWLAVAWLAADVLARLPGPLVARVALLVGTVAAVAMLGAQAWRVKTGRFVPTISDAE